jgi:hypothetical protein
MILRRLLACFALVVAPSALLAQAPEVGHTCVSGCGGGSSSSGTYHHHVSQAERQKHIENVQFYHHYKRYHDDFMRYVKRENTGFSGIPINKSLLRARSSRF